MLLTDADPEKTGYAVFEEEKTVSRSKYRGWRTIKRMSNKNYEEKE